MQIRVKKQPFLVLVLIIFFLTAAGSTASILKAASLSEDTQNKTAALSVNPDTAGGGYAITGQLENTGYATEIYNAENGLPTSDANCILSASDGYLWIGGYSGIIRYDGKTFERLDSSGGLANGRVFFEDSRHRIWVGTNDSGIVVLDGKEAVHITYKEGLPSSSIRGFGEGPDGTIYAGSTNGVSCIDASLQVSALEDPRLLDQYIIRMCNSPDGRIYGCTRNGDAFCIDSGEVSVFFSGSELGTGPITTIFADPNQPGMVYLGTESDKIYYGMFGGLLSDYAEISVSPASKISWITSACQKIWVCSGQMAGYLDEEKVFHVLKDLPLNNAIEMMTQDYQGNLWFASSRQGIMKIVSSNFQNITELAGLEEQVVNSTCRHDGLFYIGTDSGLQILDASLQPVENELSAFIGSTRIRCIMEDHEGNLWLSTYADGKGLVCYTSDKKLQSYTEENGYPNNETRCTALAADGSILAGTNGGLAVLKDGKIIRTVGEEEGLSNTVLLTVEEDEDGNVLAGTDGDGLYLIDGENVKRFGRDEGLTSDVILRVRRDERRGVYWIITSNSIEYMKNGTITPVDTFPYNNNFDIYFDNRDNLWILSSYGVFCVKAQDMLNNQVTDYRIYNTDNGLTGVPTANAYSALDEEGNLYIAARSGVCRVNINHFYERSAQIRLGIKSITCSAGEILPDTEGVYTLPPDAGRIQILPAILDYTMSNPSIRIFLEGSDDPGITAPQKSLSALEFTGLAYGSYILHIQIVDPANQYIYQEETFSIIKKPRFSELLVVKLLFAAFLVLLAVLFAWRIMSGTIIRRQYEQIRLAKEEAERANKSKSLFLTNMSAEIRTPIHAIMGMDEMILRENAADVPKNYRKSVVKYAMDIKNSSEILLSMVNDLLDLSRIESGKLQLVEQEYDTEEFYQSVLEKIRIQTDQKDLQLITDIDSRIPVRLYGDVGKLRQILHNLLSNAVKYTDMGSVTFTVSIIEKTADTCRLRISVKDTGIGIRQEEIEKLFTAYEQFDEETYSSTHRTGLGLDISGRFAKMMDGELTCDSTPGKGTEFIFTFSQTIISPEEMGEFKERENNSGNAAYVPRFVAPEAEILVVDDNPVNLTVIRALLKETGMFVTTASSGEECLEKLKYGRFHIVLLDHNMPGMNGMETIAKIREKYPSLPVYALTATASVYGTAFYREKGFDGYLEKPVDGTVLEKVIMKHLPKEIMMKPVEK